MQKFRISLAIVVVAYVLMLSMYLGIMYWKGNIGFSGDSQNWGNLGSYIGGFFTPIAALLSGYFVYISFAANANQQKLALIRETLLRLDEQLEENLNAPFRNRQLGDKYYNTPFKDLVIAISNGDVEATQQVREGILSLLHNVAILINSVKYYISLISELPSDKNDTDWLGNLERGYWIQKYSPICQRMVNIVGKEAFENKISKEEVFSFNDVLRVK